MSLSKRQEERHLRVIRELLKLPENKKCFDCPAKSPVYVNLMNNTFICAQCSGLHRELSHRVKSLSASTFTTSEVSALKEGGNQRAKSIWLAKITPQDIIPDLTTVEGVRKFMRQKYVEKRYLDKEAFSVLKKNQSLESLTGSDGKSTYSSPSTSAISLGHIGTPGGIASPMMTVRGRRGSVKTDQSTAFTSPKLGTAPYSPKMFSEEPALRSPKPVSTSPKQDDFTRAFGDLSVSSESLKSNVAQAQPSKGTSTGHESFLQNGSQPALPKLANVPKPTFNDIFSDSLQGIASSPLPVQEAPNSSRFDQAFLASDLSRTNSLPNPVSPTGNNAFDDIFKGYASPQPGPTSQPSNMPYSAAFELRRSETAPAHAGQHGARDLNLTKPLTDYSLQQQYDSQRTEPYQPRQDANSMDPFDALLNYRPAPQPLSQPQPPTSSFDSLFGVASSTPQPPVTASFSSFEQKFPPTDLYHASPVEPSSMVEKKGNRNSISHLFQLQLQSQPRPQPQPSHADPPAATQDSSNPAMDDFLAELTGNKGGPVAPSTGFGYLPAGDSMSSHFSAKGAYDRQNGTNQTFGLDRGHPFIPGNSAMHSFVDQTAPVNPIYQPTSGEGRSPFQPTPSYPGNSAKANPFFTSQASHAPNRSASVPVSSEGSKPLFPVAGNYGSSLKNSPQSLQASPPPLRSESPFSQPFRSMSYSPSASSPQSPSIPGKNPFSANNEGSSQPPTVANPFGANRTVEKGIVTSASIFGNNSRTNHRFGNTSLNQTASSSFLDDLDPLKNDVKFGGSSLKNENKWYH